MSRNTIQINVSIPKTLNAELREQAVKEGRSLSNLVANILKEGMETRGNG
jgi:predicted HicB family RNase H-like nuclease